MTKILFVIACAVLAAACGDPARMSPVSPTPVVAVATPPPPPAVNPFQDPYTELTIGSTVQRKVDRSANPECIGVPGFGCQYFRITPDRDGLLDVELTWKPETQPSQTLDLSHRSATDEQWADYPSALAATAHLTSRVKAGETSEITVWYTFPGVEFSLQTRLQPD